MDAVTDRIWPEGLTRIPYWLYTDPDVLALEQKRLFEGPVWNYLCLETELPNIGDYRTTFVGRMPVVVVRAEDGELCAFENRCAHRGALICLDDCGSGEGLPVRLSLLALRPARQPALDRVRPRRQRQRRHAGRLRHDAARPAQAARHHVLRHGVRHAVA